MSATTDSILLSVKKQLGIHSSDTSFDDDIVMAINTAFVSYHQMGIDTSSSAYYITGSTEKWTDYPGFTQDIHSIKTLTYLKVKKIFDPTASSSIGTSIDESIKELEWRIYTEKDGFNN